MPDTYPPAWPVPAQKVNERYWLHISLFLATLISTVWAGGSMVGRFEYYEAMGRWWTVFGLRFNVDFLLDGLRFGGSLLLFLTVHEFGHYFAARYHSVRTSLPYYIPFPFNGIGTFGAVIRIRDQVPSLKKLFDIGVAGPVAGFVVSLAVLGYGLATLPGPEFLLGVPGHEALKQYILDFGSFPSRMDVPQDPNTISLVVGQTPLYWLLTRFTADVPPMWEMYHYPFLFAGWLGLFFTALNMLPVGQLDGGHVLYALVGPVWHGRLARGFVLLLLASGAIGFVGETAAFRSQSLARELAVWAGLSVVLFLYLRRMLGSDLATIAPSLLGLVTLAAVAEGIGAPLLTLGYSGWLIWCALIVFLVRVDHPPVLVHEPLTRGRRALAYASLVIFVLCFSLKPLYVL